MDIRPFRAEDAPALARIFHSAVHQIARRHYSAEQVEAWAPEIPDPERYVERAKDGRLFLVAVDDLDRPLAYGDLEPNGHVDHFFCRPDFAGTGVTSALYDEVEAEAVRRGIHRLFVEASEPARRFFLKKDFIILERRDFTLGAVAIHNYAMEQRLNA